MIRSVARGVWWGGAGCRHGGVCEREAGATGASAQRNGKTCAEKTGRCRCLLSSRDLRCALSLALSPSLPPSVPVFFFFFF
eukprot:COSAG03_NODE_25752_length_263_cov_1.756098_1_plen_80_part_01